MHMIFDCCQELPMYMIEMTDRLKSTYIKLRNEWLAKKLLPDKILVQKRTFFALHTASQSIACAHHKIFMQIARSLHWYISHFRWVGTAPRRRGSWRISPTALPTSAKRWGLNSTTKSVHFFGIGSTILLRHST